MLQQLHWDPVAKQYWVELKLLAKGWRADEGLHTDGDKNMRKNAIWGTKESFSEKNKENRADSEHLQSSAPALTFWGYNLNFQKVPSRECENNFKLLLFQDFQY